MNRGPNWRVWKDRLPQPGKRHQVFEESDLHALAPQATSPMTANSRADSSLGLFKIELCVARPWHQSPGGVAGSKNKVMAQASHDSTQTAQNRTAENKMDPATSVPECPSSGAPEQPRLQRAQGGQRGSRLHPHRCTVQGMGWRKDAARGSV